ncbi:mediator of RNA polymerase II transcription subunit 4-like [Argentina anserina]|uniref:mediator of RNA polymerase II transcription subunit 4-like n=1 Tax=Argentina anserina TaxID=57926 RepID=UPI0021764074|nr:mediator of RNA polymerase II transcription subunit 4-like [Potentilla anserina]XP_050385266.1 mediator of RNA polymerase II transcription subunit 4-like [Potentilla anserina]
MNSNLTQHQIVQSPARLGLANPTSPSLQNPNPPKPTSLQSNASSTLISLLPPLPRAQSLLVQMASLASKLFEVSPNRSLWVNAFRGSLPTFLPSQSQSVPVTAVDSNPSSIKEILAQFSVLQTQLFEAVAKLQDILDLQDSKLKIAREIRSKDAALLAFSKKLKDAEQILDNLVDDYSDFRRPKRMKQEEDDADDEESSCTTTVASKLKLSDIMSYAHRISYTTFAPPDFGAGQAPLRAALPPAPQDEQMRASQLYHFANLDVGLPKTVESEEKTFDAIMEPPPPQPTEYNQQAGMAPLQGILPPNFTIPAPPPGWKPGDPVPLDSLPTQVRGNAPQGIHNPPATIQVQHVQLDILDQDDDSSEYSSDEASSDDDD